MGGEEDWAHDGRADGHSLTGVSVCQMLKKMEQVKKKAEAVVNTVDISEREKMAQLKRWVPTRGCSDVCL